MKVPRIALLASSALLIAPAGASAAPVPSSVAPPGSAAVDQYREAAPPAGSNSKKLSAKQREALQSQGKDGAALAAVLDRSGGVPGGGASSGGDGSSANGTSSSSSSSAERSGKRGDARNEKSGAEQQVEEASIAPDRSAVTSTVGPFPIWTLLMMAAVLVVLALIVRRRPTA